MNRLPHLVLKEIGFTLLAEGKTLKVKAEGYSMYPAVRPGSVIYIEPFEKGMEPVPGEVIAWKKDPGFVVHRLVRIIYDGSSTLFVTRGDSCQGEDDPVTAGQLAGRVIRVETPGGKILRPDSFSGKKPYYRLNRILLRINSYMRRVGL